MMASEEKATDSESETVMRLVPRMRIDFKVMPATKNGHYCPYSAEQHIVRKVKKLLGKGTSIPEDDLHLEPSEWCLPVGTGWEVWTPADFERQLKFGDPGYLIIRDLSFVDRFDGVDWDAKFYKARKFLLRGLHYSLFAGSSQDQSGGPQYVSTFLKPEEDYWILNHQVSVSPPTFILKGVPSEWLADPHSILKLRQLFQSLANLRNFDTTRNSILIQYEDYEQFCKALKQLCSRSLKKNGDSRMVIDYELTLEDSLVLVSNESQQMPIHSNYNESATTKALNLRVEMIEKELETVKAMMNPSKKKKAMMKESGADYRI